MASVVSNSMYVYTELRKKKDSKTKEPKIPCSNKGLLFKSKTIREEKVNKISFLLNLLSIYIYIYYCGLQLQQETRGIIQ